MFILKKIITSFILPPGIFILILFALGSYHFFIHKRKIGGINIILALLMWSLSITPVSNFLLKVLSFDYGELTEPKGDVIILLGGGIYDNTPDLSGIGVPYQNVQAGIITSIKLYKRLKKPIMVVGGKGFSFQREEAQVIRRFLIDLGIPDHSIITENKSRDTFENAKYAKIICEERGFKKPILVTSAYHMMRSVIIFRKFGMNVTPFPSIFPSWNNNIYHWNDFLPGDFKRVSFALREYFGIIYYKIVY